jgi:hypothetical protein
MAIEIIPFVAKAIKDSPIEAKIVRKVCKALKDSGNPVVSVFDGDDTTPVESTQDVLALVFNLDEAWLTTKTGAQVFLTMGQDWDTVCDYSLSLEAALEPIIDWIIEH